MSWRVWDASNDSLLLFTALLRLLRISTMAKLPQALKIRIDGFHIYSRLSRKREQTLRICRFSAGILAKHFQL